MCLYPVRILYTSSFCGSLQNRRANAKGNSMIPNDGQFPLIRQKRGCFEQTHVATIAAEPPIIDWLLQLTDSAILQHYHGRMHRRRMAARY